MTSLEDRSLIRPVTCVDDVQATGRRVPVSDPEHPLGTLAYGTCVARPAGRCEIRWSAMPVRTLRS